MPDRSPSESATLPQRLQTLLRYTFGSRVARIATVIAGLLAVILYSVRDEPPLEQHATELILYFCLAIFTLDWIVRIGSSLVRANDYWRSGAFVIDALAVLPVPIALLDGIDPPTAWLFGALWLFKLAEFTPGLGRLGRVIQLEAMPLASVLMIFSMVLFFAAVLLHLFERQAQPQKFGSVPAALWWAVTTLTTTGYGDAVPATVPGRIIAGLVMISGVGVFGLLTGILATGFVEENRRNAFVQNWNLVRTVPFFRNLEPSALIEIARMLRSWEVSEGTTVVRRGREGDCMYFIASGEVEVDVTPPVRLGPGSFFGELALLGSGLRNATVTTILPSTLLILEAADFRTFMAHHPTLSMEIEAEADRRARDMQPEPQA